jgi:hypothetical protein
MLNQFAKRALITPAGAHPPDAAVCGIQQSLAVAIARESYP